VAFGEGTVSINSPSTLVIVPVVVPLTTTLVPGIGSMLEASVTLPLTVTCWARAVPDVMSRIKPNSRSFNLEPWSCFFVEKINNLFMDLMIRLIYLK